jgi:bifunctional enzyme CysN/CysC
MTRRHDETAPDHDVKGGALRIHVSGDPSGTTSTLAASLRDHSARFALIESGGASTRDLFEQLSNADAAVVVTARGATGRTRRDVLFAARAGVELVVVAVDMPDAGEIAADVVRGIEADVRPSAEGTAVHVVPISALGGDNVVSERGFEWYRGPAVVGLLEGLEPAAVRLAKKPFRLPVASLSNVDGAPGHAGTIASGVVKIGDAVRVRGQASRVARIARDGRDVDGASAGDSVVLVLEDAAKVSVGDLISTAERPAEVADQFEATIAWFGQTPLLRGRNYSFEIGAARATATIGSLKRRFYPSGAASSALQKVEADEVIACNLRLDHAIAFDPFRENRTTGGFRLVDPSSGAIVGVGMLHFALRRAQNVHWQAMDVNKGARSASKGQRPCVLWYTGLSGAGKSTIANLVDKKLHALGRHTYLLDGDNVRHGLNKDLGFTAADRVENIRRIAEVAKLMVDAGLIVGTAFISPFRAERSMARSLLADGEFIEIFVDTPLGVAEERDPKGLYKKARRGELKNFTGIDSPYEAPESPEIKIDTTATAPEAAADLVISMLEERGILDAG